MPNRFTVGEVTAAPRFLSAPRFATYIAVRANPTQALSLYHWNAQISAAFLFPLHMYELCIRNAAANAIAGYYGANWPWSVAFTTSLPDPPAPNFSPRKELAGRSQGGAAVGQVVANLKFAFWESIYTSRHDGRLWNSFILGEFPNFAAGTAPAAARSSIHAATRGVRALRNRIAHHEPIFARDLIADYDSIMTVIGHRCTDTANWVHRSQGVSNLLMMKP